MNGGETESMTYLVKELVVHKHQLEMIDEKILNESGLLCFCHVSSTTPGHVGSWTTVILNGHCRAHEHGHAEGGSVGAHNPGFPILVTGETGCCGIAK